MNACVKAVSFVSVCCKLLQKQIKKMFEYHLQSYILKTWFLHINKLFCYLYQNISGGKGGGTECVLKARKL